MPYFRHRSFVFAPASASLSTPMICSSVNRRLFIHLLPDEQTLLHSGTNLGEQTSPATLAEAEYEQSDGAAAARSQAADQSGGRGPGQTRCSDARRCSAAARVSYDLRHAEVHEHEAARGDVKPRSSLSSLTGDRDRCRSKQCERFLTLPFYEKAAASYAAISLAQSS